MTFGAIAIGASGIDAGQRWMDMAAGNTANSDDLSASGAPGFSATEPVFVATPGGGVGVTASTSSTQSPGLVLSASPLADASGYVQDPGVDLAQQMIDITVASSSVALNVAVINRAIDAYQSVIDLGRNPSDDD